MQSGHDVRVLCGIEREQVVLKESLPLALEDDRKLGGGGRSGPYLNSSGYGRFFLMYSCKLPISRVKTGVRYSEEHAPHHDIGHWFPCVCGKAPQTDCLGAALVGVEELFGIRDGVFRSKFGGGAVLDHRAGIC